MPSGTTSTQIVSTPASSKRRKVANKLRAAAGALRGMRASTGQGHARAKCCKSVVRKYKPTHDGSAEFCKAASNAVVSMSTTRARGA